MILILLGTIYIYCTGKSFEAEQGANDDLVMCLVIFSWMANQRYFKELTNVDVRGQMFTEQQNAIESRYGVYFRIYR